MREQVSTNIAYQLYLPSPTHNIKTKTKIMVVDKNRTDDHKFILNGEELEGSKSFVYLGSLINTEVSCMPEVNRAKVNKH